MTYRRNETPTGEEVRNIVKFYFGVLKERGAWQNRKILHDIRLVGVVTAVLTLICTAVTVKQIFQATKPSK